MLSLTYMEFITWLVALPTALLLFFFPVPVPTPQEAQIAPSAPVVEVIEIQAENVPSVKSKAISALQKEGIEVKEIKPYIAPIVLPTVPFVGSEVPVTPSQPVQAEPTPAAAPAPAPVPTTLSVTRVDLYSKAFGGNCSQIRFKAVTNKPVSVAFATPETATTTKQVANEATFTYYPQRTNDYQLISFYVEGEPEIKVDLNLNVVGTIKDELGVEKLTDAGDYYVDELGTKISKETGRCL